MRWPLLFRILFVIYCVEAGVFLVLAPWSFAWDRVLLDLPYLPPCLSCLHPALRGAVSGFGLVHLVWGAHDLDQFVVRRARRSRPS